MKKIIWPVWKTVRIGVPGLSNREDFLREFVEKNSCHDKCFEQLIATMDICYQGEEDINLALVSVAELGFLTESTKRGDALLRLESLGLGKLPAVAGFCLRAQYDNQPEEEKFHMAMNPIVLPKIGSVGLFLFGKQITGDNADHTNSLPLDCKFVCRIID
ncbi:MAG: hypothetical protein WCK10_00535 [Candidatus Staskawiczbacteria bacterium]